MDLNNKTGLQGAIVLTVLHFILSSYLLYKKKEMKSGNGF